MPTEIGLVDGTRITVPMDVEQVRDLLGGPDAGWVTIMEDEQDAGKRYFNPAHVAYIQQVDDMPVVEQSDFPR